MKNEQPILVLAVYEGSPIDTHWLAFRLDGLKGVVREGGCRQANVCSRCDQMALFRHDQKLVIAKLHFIDGLGYCLFAGRWGTFVLQLGFKGNVKITCHFEQSLVSVTPEGVHHDKICDDRKHDDRYRQNDNIPERQFYPDRTKHLLKHSPHRAGCVSTVAQSRRRSSFADV